MLNLLKAMQIFKMSEHLKREISCFIVAGIIATFTDFIIYWGLSTFIFYSVAKTFSFCSGSVVAYFLNKFITFKQTTPSVKEVMRFSLLYAFALVVNVTVNSVSIVLLPMLFLLPKSYVLVLAFLIATGFSTVMSFMGQRLWVFKSI